MIGFEKRAGCSASQSTHSSVSQNLEQFRRTVAGQSCMNLANASFQSRCRDEIAAMIGPEQGRDHPADVAA
jgi:hypothetical protein